MTTTDSILHLQNRSNPAVQGVKRSDDESSLSSGIQHACQSDVRLELLQHIKKRIKSGYYDNESIIDDIGYGFAQALNSTF